MPTVTPCVGVWIETTWFHLSSPCQTSHPAWVCGLKPVIRLSAFTHPKSHPAWVCGLKQAIAKSRYFALESHPAWVCGLKLQEAKNNNFRLVTPCVGVWIETSGLKGRSLSLTSHPAWVCGLKLLVQETSQGRHVSHPAWVCGLKPDCSASSPRMTCHTLRGCVD